MNARRAFSVLACAGFLMSSVAVHAQSFRAYVASTGNDANPCTLGAPCRLLPAALAAVADGGEIWMLDSANFNTSTVNIAKSVTILAVPGAIGIGRTSRLLVCADILGHRTPRIERFGKSLD
jgi:hypothetical protein